jgi:hypothetical protein
MVGLKAQALTILVPNKAHRILNNKWNMKEGTTTSSRNDKQHWNVSFGFKIHQ